MALDQQERLALHQGLVDGLGQPTADRLMAALPAVDWSQLATKDDLKRFDDRFALVDQRFDDVYRRMDTGFADVYRRFDDIDTRFDDVYRRMDTGFADANRRMDTGFADLNRRFDDIDPMIDGKVSLHVRSMWLTLLGLIFANAAVVAGIVALALSVSD